MLAFIWTCRTMPENIVIHGNPKEMKGFDGADSERRDIKMTKSSSSIPPLSKGLSSSFASHVTSQNGPLSPRDAQESLL
jgi:hypothetical protein